MGKNEWLKKHIDTVIIMGGILSSFLWMSGKFNDIDKRFAVIDTRLTKIETVLILQKIMPTDLMSASVVEALKEKK